MTSRFTKEPRTSRRETIPVRAGEVCVGGGAPIAVQAMTNTNTEDAEATAAQIIALAEAGAEMVRFTVNTPRAAACVSEIATRVRDAGCTVPLIGDFHYNGHKLLTEHPDCAQALDKYRINPGNVGSGERRDPQFTAICAIARDRGKAVRIGVNAGSLDSDLLARRMELNARENRGKAPEEIVNESMIESALHSTEMALDCGLSENQIVISCKTSVPKHLIAIYRELSARTRQPLHLGLTEAGMGVRGLVWSSACMGALLAEGIGDTIRVSLTPRPGGDRREEVHAAQELLQSLGLRQFAPSITACPGCGRTSSALFQELALRTEEYVRARMPEWRKKSPGVECMTIAVMGCIVNGPGESKAADIGISLPGHGENPLCPVFVKGEKRTSLRGDAEQLAAQFLALVEDFVAGHSAGPPE